MWSTALSDLRTFLSDNAEDKHNYRKPVFPAPNGAITSFKTYEFRRITKLQESVAPSGVYINDVRVPNDQITGDDLASGEFVLATPPADGERISVTYYNQWFTDAELDSFLRSASQWLLFADAFDSIPGGLQPAAKKYAASEAYMKIAMRWSQMTSEQYRVEDDVNQKALNAVREFKGLAKAMADAALKDRDSYYEKAGQSKEASFGSILGRVTSGIPRR